MSEEQETQEVARAGFDKILVTERGFDFQDARAVYAFAKTSIQAGCLPRCYERPEQVFLAIAMGRELGIQPVQAIFSLGIINNQLTPFGDLTVSRIDSSPVITDRREWFEVDGAALAPGRRPRRIKPGDDVAAICQLTYKRKGQEAAQVHESYYHLEEAEASGLYPGKNRHGSVDDRASWNRFTARMLLFKARNWGARDIDPNVLKGFADEGEVRDAWGEEREAEFEVKGSINLGDVKKAEPAADENCGAEDKAKEEDGAFEAFRAKTAQEPRFPGDAALDGLSSGWLESARELRCKELIGFAREDPGGWVIDQYHGALLEGGDCHVDLAQIVQDEKGGVATRVEAKVGVEDGHVWWELEGSPRSMRAVLPQDWTPGTPYELGDIVETAEGRVVIGEILTEEDVQAELNAEPPPHLAKMRKDKLLAHIHRLGDELGLDGKALTAFVKEQHPDKPPSQLAKDELVQVALALEKEASPAP